MIKTVEWEKVCSSPLPVGHRDSISVIDLLRDKDKKGGNLSLNLP